MAWASNIDKPKNSFDIALHTDDIVQARRRFEQLAEGSREVTPFAETL